jgi:hypothetical protein
MLRSCRHNQRASKKDPAAFLTLDVDRAERGCRQRDEHAWMGGDSLGNALAAAKSRADELVGVRPVNLRAGRALGGAAGLARDRQDAARLVDGGIAVEQFAAGAWSTHRTWSRSSAPGRPSSTASSSNDPRTRPPRRPSQKPPKRILIHRY